MFADCMLETSRTQRSRRGWTTLISFGLEVLAIGLLLLLPLWKTVGLPKARVVSTPISAGRPEPAPVPRPPHSGRTTITPANSTTARFVAPGHIPDRIPTSDDGPAPDPSGSCINCTPAIGNVGTPDGLLTGIPNGSRPMPKPPAPAAPTHTFRPSTLLEGSLIHRVVPVYPPLARTTRIQGAVVLFAVISKAGTIANLRLVSGHPMLVPAAIDAVSQWRYRPYILNNEPVEVETQITVNFILGN